jgi:enoyl-CoA hydratase
MVLFGQVVDGRGAERIGLVWRSVEPDELLDEAVVVAAHAASNPKPLLAATKQTMADMIGIDDHPSAVERELTTQVWSVEQGWIAERLKR